MRFSAATTKSILDALNLVYGEEEKRGFVRLTLIALAITIAAIIFVLLALAAMIAVPPMLNAVGPGARCRCS
jgi:membrane protein